MGTGEAIMGLVMQELEGALSCQVSWELLASPHLSPRLCPSTLKVPSCSSEKMWGVSSLTSATLCCFAQ